MKIDSIANPGFSFFLSLLLSLIFTPLVRLLAVKLNIFDHPITSVKTHKAPVPYLGGVAIYMGFVISLIVTRFLSSYPSGTLRSLRGIVLGATIIFILGLVDDIRTHGLHYRTKFAYQVLAAGIVILFGIRIRFIHPSWMAYVLTMVWIVGVTNAFNLIDIMDGLASGVAMVVTAAFVFITLPTEELYVNYAASALCGAAMGFFPYNLSKRFRLFMGDSGSLLLGFVCSSLALGTSYGNQTEWGVFAPLMILCLPIFDTLFVFAMRILRGISPFLGSKDHFALRMEILGWKRPAILIFSMAFSFLLCSGAFFVTRVSTPIVFSIYFSTMVLLALFVFYLIRAKVN